MKMSINDLTRLDNEALYDLIRTALAFRLIGLPVSYISQCCGITKPVVQKILLENGEVARRGHLHHWVGPYSISAELHASLSLPPYIPMRAESASWRVKNEIAWMALIRDAPVLRMPDGSRRLYDGETKEGAEPFYRDQGATYETPPIDR